MSRSICSMRSRSGRPPRSRRATCSRASAWAASRISWAPRSAASTIALTWSPACADSGAGAGGLAAHLVDLVGDPVEMGVDRGGSYPGGCWGSRPA
jgi:hypothetical protein